MYSICNNTVHVYKIQYAHVRVFYHGYNISNFQINNLDKFNKNFKIINSGIIEKIHLFVLKAFVKSLYFSLITV